MTGLPETDIIENLERTVRHLNAETFFNPLWSGQNPTGCREIGAAEMTRRLAANC